MRTVAVHRKIADRVAKRAADDVVASPRLSPDSQYSTSHSVAPHLHLVAPAAVSESIGVYRAADSSWTMLQPALLVSRPEDASEQEATATASKVARMSIRDGSVAYVNTATGRVFRLLKSPAAPESFQITQRPQTLANAALTIPLVRRQPVDYRIQCHPEKHRGASASATSGIQSKMAGGAPLPMPVRRFMEPRFGADFSNVRIHTDDHAAALNRQLSARAFTVHNHVFFSQGSFQPETEHGRELIAHELTHTIQQGAAVQREALQQSEAPDISQHSEPMVHRLGLSDILDGLASLAANLPGYTLLTVIIGRNPINMRPVERNFTNLLRGFMGLIPGGEILFQVLNHYQVVQRLGTWASEQMTSLGLNFEYLRARFTAFTDSLSWTDIFSPGDVWRRAENIFSEPIERIRNFITRLISQAITWLKETFMQPLSEFCREIPGYTLVTVLLGRDPFTNAPVDRSALNLVRAFAEFIPGGTEKVNQLVESRALQRAYEWFIQETQARNLTWARVTGTFAQAWNSLQLEDILHPIDTLQRMITLFRPLMTDLVSFAGAALMKLLELIFEAAMGAGGARILAILKRGRDTFFTIIRDPVGFLGNLLRAVGQGVRQFMTNILTHLRTGVIAWLTGPVAQAGIQIPEQWDLRGIVWFVMQILGLTWDRVRQKLVRLLGERAVAMLEAGFQLIQDIRRVGFVQALRDRVTEFFGQLREAALGSIRSFIQERLVMAGIQQLISLLSPVGAVIQAIIKTYTTIKFFIDRINQILDLVESVVNSVSAIASGSIGQAANFIERTMARTIPVILDFLARFIGLGDVGGQVQRTIRSLQARVDQMLDRAVEWIRTMAQRVVAAGRSAVAAVVQWWRQRKAFRSRSGASHSLYSTGEPPRLQMTVASVPKGVRQVIREVVAAKVAANQAVPPELSTGGEALQILDRLETMNATSADTEPQRAAIETDLTRLATILAVHLPSETLPLTAVTFSTSNTFAQRILAKPLTPRAGNTTGSTNTTSVDSLFPPPLNRMTWKALHLLNAELHGPNQRWNLIPGDQSANTTMSGIEQRVKQRVNAPGIVWYEVTVQQYQQNATISWHNAFARKISVRGGTFDPAQPGATPEDPQLTNTNITSGPPPASFTTPAVVNFSHDGMDVINGAEDPRQPPGPNGLRPRLGGQRVSGQPGPTIAAGIGQLISNAKTRMRRAEPTKSEWDSPAHLEQYLQGQLGAAKIQELKDLLQHYPHLFVLK